MAIYVVIPCLSVQMEAHIETLDVFKVFESHIEILEGSLVRMTLYIYRNTDAKLYI